MNKRKIKCEIRGVNTWFISNEFDENCECYINLYLKK